jgi:hypothetical protein
MLKNFVTPIINMFVALEYPRFTVADRCRGLSLSSTLVSRMMLRLRSDGDRHSCDSRMTEQTTVLITLSDLSGELDSIPPTPSDSLRFGGSRDGNEEDSELKRD